MCGRRIAGFVFLLSLRLAGQHGSTTAVNPYTGREHAAAGARLYRGQCAGCHGPEGEGTGTGPVLATGQYRHGATDEALFQTITKGIPGTAMPGFKLTGLQTWQLVTHLRSLVIARGASLAKGDTAAGARVFQASCSGCHTVGGAGGLSGPDLTSVASRHTLSDLRRSVLEPDADVASAYWSVALRLKSGGKLSGTRLNEDTHSIQMRDPGGRLVSVLRRDIAESELIRKSPMPAFAGKLSESEIENLLAYLTTLRGDR
jgi:putative heme-binding domain-containing protein